MGVEPTESDADALARMGYAQELLRSMSGFSNFAMSFAIICILAGGVTSFHLALSGVGGAAILDAPVRGRRAGRLRRRHDREPGDHQPRRHPADDPAHRLQRVPDLRGRHGPDRRDARPWTLGAWYRPVAALCVLGCAVVLYVGVQPPNEKALTISVGALLVTLVVWFGN